MCKCVCKPFTWRKNAQEKEGDKIEKFCDFLRGGGAKMETGSPVPVYLEGE